ncbi:MAG: hypothetical protein ACOX1M_04825 [Erysipelotrichaceae bacterium]
MKVIKSASIISQGISDKTILEVFNEIIKEFDIYEKLHSTGEVELSVAILEYVSDLAIQLGQIGYNYSEFSRALRKDTK